MGRVSFVKLVGRRYRPLMNYNDGDFLDLEDPLWEVYIGDIIDCLSFSIPPSGEFFEGF